MDPSVIQKLCRDGLELQRAGQFAAARQCYEEILRSDPSHFDALHLLGALFVQTRQPGHGIPLIHRAISTNRQVPHAHVTLAKALNQMGRHKDALASADRALALNSGFVDAHLSRAESLIALQRHSEGLQTVEHALALSPDSTDALTARAAILQQLGRPDEALVVCDRIVQLNPGSGTAHLNRGITLRTLGRSEEALASYDKALALGVSGADLHYNRSVALRDFNRDAEALASCEAAIVQQPGYVDALFARSVLLLRMGRFERGWAEYECRKAKWGQSTPRLDDARQWRGGSQELKGKTLFVYHEQGLGDSIQFFRYVFPMLDAGAKLCISCPSALRELFKAAAPQATFIATRATPPHFDYHCPLLSLPLAFGTTARSVPAPSRYLAADPGRRARFEQLLGRKRKLRIGIAWSGASAHLNDRNRSIRFELLRDLCSLDAEWISLQKEIRSSDALAFSDCGNVAFFGHELKDFGDTAALTDLADIVITVDTSVAHLAAAMGKPVWLMLPYSPDWRWLLDRDDSPWYPSVRLFRQSRPGDWKGVIERVKTELTRKLAESDVPLPSDRAEDEPTAATGIALRESSSATVVARTSGGEASAYQLLSRDIAELLNKPLFFIGAYPKSGTTWLQLMLNAHPEIACGGEGHFANHLAPLLQSALRKHNAYIDAKNKSIFREFAGFPLFGDDAFRFLVASAIAVLLLQVEGAKTARMIGEKTPDNVAAFPILAELFPAAKFLHVIRDGRDCLVSAWFHNQRVNSEELQRKFPTLEHFVDHFAQVWAGRVAEGARFCSAQPDRGMTVRYEDLIAQPEETLKTVLEFLNVDRSADIVRQCISLSSFEKLTGRSPGVEDRSSFLRRGTTGNWREHFTPNCQSRFFARAGKMMAKLGYDPE